MAKAREIPGIDRDTPYALAAARVVRVRSAELIEHSRGVLDIADIERVHAMRVATRRLRAALEVFGTCFPKDQLKVALREVKATADALGERRDRDVTLDALAGFGQALAAPDRPGVASLAARLRAEQAQANEELAPFVDEARLSALRDRLEALVKAAEEVGADAPVPDAAAADSSLASASSNGEGPASAPGGNPMEQS